MTESVFMKHATVNVIAGKGGGKTEFTASEADKMPKFVYVDTLGVLDPKRENHSAKIPNSNYYRAGHGKTAVEVFKSWFYDQKKYDRHVIDLSESKDAKNDIEELSAFLYMLGKQGRGYPFLIDEISLIAPQRGGVGANLRMLAVAGRNYGIKPLVLITQRPQNTDKELVELSDESFLGYQKGYNTTEMLGKVADIDPNVFKKIPPRTFYIVGEEKMYPVPYYRHANQQK